MCRVQAEEVWLRCWNKLAQSEIQCWITQILHSIRKIFELEEGNEY